MKTKILIFSFIKATIISTFLFTSCEIFDDDTPKERHNLYDYTVGETKIADKYEIPLLDLYNKSGLTYENRKLYISSDSLHYNEEGYKKIAELTTEFIYENGGYTDYSGKTIGIFGGSFSVIEASKACKNIWTKELGITYTDYGVRGAGFSTLTNNPVPSQVDSADIHDIYILWCSTNDCLKNVPIKDVNSPDIESQSYGMSNTIGKLRSKNPSCTILIFNSLKTYLYNYLYDKNTERY